MVFCVCKPSYAGGIGRRITVQCCLPPWEKCEALSEKTTKAKCKKDLAHMVMYLLSKYKTLSLNSSTAKKQERKKKR
jgi:hypothetical protein